MAGEGRLSRAGVAIEADSGRIASEREHRFGRRPGDGGGGDAEVERLGRGGAGRIEEHDLAAVGAEDDAVGDSRPIHADDDAEARKIGREQREFGRGSEIAVDGDEAGPPVDGKAGAIWLDGEAAGEEAGIAAGRGSEVGVVAGERPAVADEDVADEPDHGNELAVGTGADGTGARRKVLGGRGGDRLAVEGCHAGVGEDGGGTVLPVRHEANGKRRRRKRGGCGLAHAEVERGQRALAAQHQQMLGIEEGGIGDAAGDRIDGGGVRRDGHGGSEGRGPSRGRGEQIIGGERGAGPLLRLAGTQGGLGAGGLETGGGLGLCGLPGGPDEITGGGAGDEDDAGDGGSNCGAEADSAGFRQNGVLAGAGSVQIGAIDRGEIATELVGGPELFGGRETGAGVDEELRAAGIGVPIGGGAAQRFDEAKIGGILDQPSVEGAPLAEQRLVRGLDRALAGGLVDVSRQQTLADHQVDQRHGLGRDFGETGDAAAGRTGGGIDAGEPGDEAAPQQREARGAIARNGGVAVGLAQGLFDGGLDGAADAAELFVFGELQVAVGAIVAIKALEGEGEERQRILGAALLDVAQERIDEGFLNDQLAAGGSITAGGAADDVAEAAGGHWRQVNQVVRLGSGEFGARLQLIEGVRANREEDEDRRIVGCGEIGEEGEEGTRLRGVGGEQLLGLVDGDDEGRRATGGGVAGILDVGEELQQRPDRGSTTGNGGADVGAVAGDVARSKGGFEHGRKAVVAGERRAFGTDDGEHREMPAVAAQARQEAGAEERGFARARGAEDGQKARRGSGAEAAQGVEGEDGGAIAAEEDAGVVRLERQQSPIGGAARIAVGRPQEVRGVEPGFFEAGGEAGEAGARKLHRGFRLEAGGR